MKQIVFQLCLSILLISCEYQPSTENFVNIDQETFGDISIDLSRNQDTMVLFTKTDFTFKTEVNADQIIHTVKVYLGDKTIMSGNSSQSFSIDPYYYQTGCYPLKIEVITSTGTGSLADVAGGETLHYSKQWVVIIDKSEPKPLNITSISRFNGQLKIEWEKNEAYNFYNYSLNRTLLVYDDNQSLVYTIFKTLHRNLNWCIDDSYIGGKVVLSVRNVSKYDETDGADFVFDAPYPKIMDIQKINGDSIIIKWNKCDYEGNFSRYEISELFKNQNSFNNVITNNNIDDTISSRKIIFGDETEIKLTTYSKAFYCHSYEHIMDKKTVYAGEKSPVYTYVFYPNISNRIYFVNNHKVSLYDLSNDKEISYFYTKKSCTYDTRTLDISDNGEYLVLATVDKLIVYDPVTLQSTNEIDLTYFMKTTDISSVQVTNNGLVTFYYKMENSSFYKSVIFDIKKQDTIWTESGISFNFTGDGHYVRIAKIFDYNKLFSFENDTFNFIGDIEDKRFMFNNLNYNQFYYLTSNSIELYDCSTMQKIDYYNHNLNSDNPFLDPISGHFMITNSPSTRQIDLKIIDFDKKQIIDSRKIGYLSSTFYRYLYFNNTLYSGAGYKLKLEK